MITSQRGRGKKKSRNQNNTHNGTSVSATPSDSKPAKAKHVDAATGAEKDYIENEKQMPKVRFNAPPPVWGQPVLLTDQQVAEFITNGYLVLQPELPYEFHEAGEFHAFDKRTSPGNNILPLMPMLQQVFDSPTVAGALKSLLGENYAMHSHRHPHKTSYNSPDQNWHKDTYWGYHKPRYLLPRWIMGMYYAQKTTLDMGPTGIVPGTHLLSMPDTFERRSKQVPLLGENAKPLYVECPAGSVVLIHYDIWHRGSSNKTHTNRYMFKFQFYRMEEPKAPTWNCTSPNWPQNVRITAGISNTLLPVWLHIWEWLCGRPTGSNATNTALLPPPPSPQEAVDAIKNARSEAEPGRLNAAFRLARAGRLDVLAEHFLSTDDWVSRTCGYALAAMGDKAVEPLVRALRQDLPERTRARAAFHLGDMGSAALSAVPALVAALQKEKAVLYRRCIAEALGLILSTIPDNQSEMKISGATALAECMRTEADDQCRFEATLALARCRGAAAHTLPMLRKALYDSDRYVVGYVLDALRGIGSAEANALLMQYLWTARWDPLTTPSSQF